MKSSKLASIKKRLPRGSAFGVCAAVFLALVIGCAGGGDQSGASGAGGSAGGFGIAKSLSGTNTDVAVGALTAKATASGVGVPFMVLNSVSPSGPLHRNRLAAQTPSPVPGLGLFSTTSVSGKTETINFFSDSAGKTNVGKVTVVSTETIGSTYTYPLTFTATGSISGGNVPLTIPNNNPIKVTFSDAKKNTFTGGLNITDASKDQISLNISLSLNDQGELGPDDFITATYSYTYLVFQVPVSVVLNELISDGTATKAPTVVQGTATVSVTNPLNIDPSTGKPVATTSTGQGRLDLQAGTFSLSGFEGTELGSLLSTYNISTDQLEVKVGSGFDKIIDHASAFNISTLLTSSGTTSSGGTNSGGTNSGGTNSGTNGGTTGTTAGTYAAPVQLQGSGRLQVDGALGDGELVGFSSDSSGQVTGYYWPSPTSAPQALTGPNGAIHTAAHGIATYAGQTVIVGSYVDSHGQNQPCFWTSTAGTGAFNAFAANGTLPCGGVFNAISANGNIIAGYKYDSSFVQHPIAYLSGTLYDLPSDGRTTDLRAVAVDNNGDIVGSGQGNSTFPVAWTHVTVDTTANTITVHPTALQNLQGSASNTQVLHVSDNGIIVGGDGFNAFCWMASDGYKQHLIPAGENFGVNAFAINHAGTEAGGYSFASSPAQTVDLAVWPTLSSTPIDVTTQLGTSIGNFQSLAAYFILDNGSLICLAQVKGTTNVTFVYVQKK